MALDDFYKINVSLLASRPSYPPPSTPGTVTLNPFLFEVKKLHFVDQALHIEGFRSIRHVELVATVRHRDTGDPVIITFRKAIPRGMPDHEAARELLLDALRHETDECLLVDGVRVNDPHANGRTEI